MDLISVFDWRDLGVIFLLKGRLVIQRLCKNNLSCDEPVGDDTAQECLNWRNKQDIGSQRTLVMSPVVLYAISQMHVKVDMVNPAISNCYIKQLYETAQSLHPADRKI